MSPTLRLAFPLGLLASAFVLLQACDREPLTPQLGVAGGVMAASVEAAAQRPPVVISQVYGGGGNSGAPYDRDFVELFNPGDQAVNITGWRVQYASATGSSWSFTALGSGDATGMIQPGGYYLVQLAGGTTGDPLPDPDDVGTTNMAAASGKVVLTQAGVTLSGDCPGGAGLVDRVNYGAANCAAEWGTTPNLSNATAALRSDDGCAITGDVSADFFRDAPAPRNSASPSKTCPPPGGEPAAVTVSPAEAGVAAGATVSFSASAKDAAGEFAFTTFTWSSGDEAVAAVDAETGVATGVAPGTVVITATARNGVSGDATLVVSAAPAIVISQVYGGGGNSGAPYNRDFVELFNRGREAVDISGWTVQYASASGSTWQVTTLPAGSIQPGGYYLVQLAGGSTGEPLPAADAVGTTNMAAGSGKVVLARPGTTVEGFCPTDPGIADRVNYGTANCAGEWGTTPTLSNSTAALRHDAGCAYTGDVSADFSRDAPMPRNSATPVNSCRGPPVSVTVSPSATTVSAGGSQAFTATALDDLGDVTATTFTWTSSNGTVATVAAGGVATGLEEGTVTITATSANGVAGTASLTVTPMEPRTGLIITEFLADPAGSDLLGEWFEVFNAGPGDIDLAGWRLESGSSTGLETHTIASSVVVPEGGFAVLGNNGDFDTNGGVHITYEYGTGNIILNNSTTDWLVIKRPDGTLQDSASYSTRDAAGNIVDPRYAPTVATSRILIDENLDNNIAASGNWRDATLPFGDGSNLGSPGWGAYGTAGSVATVMTWPADTSVVMGMTVQPTAVAIDALGRVSEQALTWSTSDASVATVDAATGLVSAGGEGAVEIRATAATGAVGTITMHVVHPDSPASVTVGISDPNWVPVGYTKRTFATVRTYDGTIIPPEVTWSVSDAALAEIVVFDGRTYVATLGAGSVRVIATAANGVSGASAPLTILPADAPTSAVYRNHLEFGVPARTRTLPGQVIPIDKLGFSAGYNPARGGPDWVSWNMNATHFGSVSRCNCFSPDLEIPEGVFRVVDSDFIGSGYDRGHMVQSESRTTTEQENAATFLLTNILPQAPDNNQGSWYSFERHLNDLARNDGKEIYTIAGGEWVDDPPTLLDQGKVQIPHFTWKIAVVLEAGQGLADVTSPWDVKVKAVRMPNLVATAERDTPWDAFATTIDVIEEAVGYSFLTELPELYQRILKSGTSKPVASIGGPYAGLEGHPIRFDGSASFDPDPDDVLTFVWDFGDGATGTGATPSHTYRNNGVYDARLIVADQHGAADTAFAAVTVHDRTNSVAGGGTFELPGGGRASVSLNARHRPEGPSGQLELNADPLGLHFNATDVQWLVIEEGRATLRGAGRIDGDDEAYSYDVVVDSSPARGHRIRIVIRDAAGAVVFDNLPGEPADALGALDGSLNVRP
jgi:DNA/RNA endonuclease G (NUC1)